MRLDTILLALLFITASATLTTSTTRPPAPRSSSINLAAALSIPFEYPATSNITNGYPYGFVDDEPEDDAPVELRRRQGPCGSQYGSCMNAGAPGLCCPLSAVCSADYAGSVACCPLGSACTGTVGGPPTTQTPLPGGYVLATTTTTAVAPPATGGGFDQGDGTISAEGSTVVVLQGTGAANGRAGLIPLPIRCIAKTFDSVKNSWRLLR